MLHGISWMHFIKWILFLTLIYYAGIIALFFRKEAVKLLRWQRKTVLLAAGLTGYSLARAQDGNQGINQANSLMRGYFDTGTQLMYAIGAVIALIGAIQVFRKWNSDEGHGHAYAAATQWFGSCIFLVVVTSVIRSFFGL
jgi:hypothetical protein